MKEEVHQSGNVCIIRIHDLTLYVWYAVYGGTFKVGIG